MLNTYNSFSLIFSSKIRVPLKRLRLASLIIKYFVNINIKFNITIIIII